MRKELGRGENNKITIDPKIVMFHRDVIDFIILHDYCHLKYKTHTKNFYRMIEKYENNFERDEKIIKVSLFHIKTNVNTIMRRLIVVKNIMREN